MKEFLPLDVVRILRAMDTAEFGAIMRELSIEVALVKPSEARARLIAEAGTRAMFLSFLVDDEEDSRSFTMDLTPAENMTTL